MTPLKKPNAVKPHPNKPSAAAKTPPAKAKGQATNKTANSLVKTVVLEDIGKWVTPKSGEKFSIDENAAFPSITFEIATDEPAPYEWSWTISWPAGVSGLKESAKRGKSLKTYSEKGESFKQDAKTWTVNLSKVIGGTLTVVVKAGKENFKRSIYIVGKNPSKTDVVSFLNTINDIKGFEELLEQESKFKHFINADNMPVVAFDGGYGMTQMTTPAPTYEQIWSWKENIKGGTSLYKDKQKIAKNYLSQHKRTYTDEQLKLETWSRWNGGAYHIWDEKEKAWVRNPDILCDTATGNIGWNTKLESNKEKTEAELHERDANTYAKPKEKKPENQWKYTGICYADHVNH
jgi:hypothetical protein